MKTNAGKAYAQNKKRKSNVACGTGKPTMARIMRKPGKVCSLHG
jgi:hypothetical protein